MKKLSEMQIAKDAILSDVESSDKGGRKVGNGTDYYGPSNPSSITTYVDGMHWGEDGSSGSLFGDRYDIYAYHEPVFSKGDLGKLIFSEKR